MHESRRQFRQQLAEVGENSGAENESGCLKYF